MRFAFGGIHIECSTYSRIRTPTEDFNVLSGEKLSSAPHFAFLGSYPHPFLPTFYASAVPGGPVERTTYDAFKAEFIHSLKELLPLDGLYLPMHGAMYVEGMQDAEGDWISAAREVVGAECLMSASYDLHGNLSRRIIDNIDMLSAYRTAPHIDVQETMQRACAMLLHCATRQIRPTLVWAPVPVLLPGERTSTEDQPAKDLYAQLPLRNANPGVLDASLLVGYVWADEPRATASVVLPVPQPTSSTRLLRIDPPAKTASTSRSSSGLNIWSSNSCASTQARPARPFQSVVCSSSVWRATSIIVSFCLPSRIESRTLPVQVDLRSRR